MKPSNLLSQSESEMLKLEYEIHRMDLEKAKGDFSDLTPTKRGLQIILDKDQDPETRNSYIFEILEEGGRLTGAIDQDGKRDKERFTAHGFGTAENLEGVNLMCFSREFVEAERMALAIRAKLLALETGVNLRGMTAINEDTPADTQLKFLAQEKGWVDVAKRITLLHRLRCVDALSAGTEDDFDSGNLIKVPLNKVTLPLINASAEKEYPSPWNIATYLTEEDSPEGRLKSYVAIPHYATMQVRKHAERSL